MALRHELALRGIDHDRHAAGIDLIRAQVGQVIHDGAMDKIGPALPVIFGHRIRHHRYVRKAGHATGPFLTQGIHVQIVRAATTPVQGHRPAAVFFDGLFDDRLDRCKAGTGGNQHHRLGRFIAQEEGAVWSFEAQDVALLHRIEYMIGEQAAGCVTDMQRDLFVEMRRVGHAVTAALAVLEQEFDVLTGTILQTFAGWQLQRQQHDVVGQALEFCDAGWQFLDREIADAGHFAHFDVQIAVGRGAAKQRATSFFFNRRQGLGLMGAVGNSAAEDFAFAAAASAVLAPIRQADTGADCRCQDGFIGSAAELVPARSDGNLESHTILNMNKSLTTKKMGLPRLLIIGCGDVGMRLLPLLRERFRIVAVTSQPGRVAELRAAGAVPIVANLDQPHSLARLARLARYVVHLAPPQSEGTTDSRTRNLCAILPDAATVVYVSTSGVYGDCGGTLIDETRPVNPVNARARRRVDAEQVLRTWARRAHGRLGILRVPGIYGADRLPLERLRKGTPALTAADDVYTNHIHADDLARIIVTALFRLQPNRVVHTVDDSAMKMGEYFDTVADAFGLPRPPRLPRVELRELVSPMLLSFMSESRRLSNRRMKQELGVRLRYPTVADALRAIKS